MQFLKDPLRSQIYLALSLVLLITFSTFGFLARAQNSSNNPQNETALTAQSTQQLKDVQEESNSFSITQIILLVLLLMISGFLSGSETSFTAVGQWKIRQLSEEGHKVFTALNNDPTRFITTCLIGSNLANIGATTLITALGINLANTFNWHQGITLGITTTIMTILVLIFGEITPKALAVHNAEAVASISIYPVYILSIILYPVAKSFTSIASSVLRLFGLSPRNEVLVTEKELELMLRTAGESGVIEAQEQEMIQGIIDLEQTLVREVMIPRVEVVALEKDTSLEEAQQKLSEKMFSRVPIFEKTLDNITGIFYSRNLLKFLSTTEKLAQTTVSELMTPPQYVPETMSILELMHKMRHSKIHMAIVIDEYGGTAGIATLEDLIEEITGEIYDETDVEKVAEITKLDDDNYRIQGSANFDKVLETLNLNFEEDDEGDFDTLAGFLVSKLGYIPTKDEKVSFEGYTFIVEEADERRILSVIVNQERESQQGNQTEISRSSTHITEP